MMNNIDKLKNIISDKNSNWLELAKWSIENKYWLDKSRKIALIVLALLREKGLTKEEFANKCDISEMQANLIVTGKYDIELSIIGKIEKTFNIEIIKIEI